MDTYGGLVWSLARRYCQSVADAEDATQEIFVEIWKSAGRYESSIGKESTFITTIARRRLIDRFRSESRRPEMEEFDDTQTHDIGVGQADRPDLAADIGVAQKALESLNEDQRTILVMGIVEGLSHSEIATRTGKPLGTVKTQMRRGLIRLRSKLEQAESRSEEAGS